MQINYSKILEFSITFTAIWIIIFCLCLLYYKACDSDETIFKFGFNKKIPTAILIADIIIATIFALLVAISVIP